MTMATTTASVPSRRGSSKLLGFAETISAAPAISRVSAPGFYPINIRALDATIISDGGFTAPVDPIWDINPSEAQIQEALRAAFLPTDKVWLDFNVLVVRVGADLVMVDSGAGSLFGPAGGSWRTYAPLELLPRISRCSCSVTRIPITLAGW